ncbi:hypothetical protein H1D32_24170 [Anaerobacillus sp. CMMVII]|uniref:hypothetical protein n=1 Tax=Anaerobacillus sp. CMMVII TaxID=2755588 RepID=UPI0021B73AD7|nr:hypothetical protein [Anaerobacillus sp. CMMVII]MCT8140497.1 hypothetical protein [Anaerobacillus sp. CMMVII]
MLELNCPLCQKRMILEHVNKYTEDGVQKKDLHFDCSDCMINLIVTQSSEIVPKALVKCPNELNNEQLRCPFCNLDLQIINYDVYDEKEGSYFEERDCISCSVQLTKIIMP